MSLRENKVLYRTVLITKDFYALVDGENNVIGELFNSFDEAVKEGFRLRDLKDAEEQKEEEIPILGLAQIRTEGAAFRCPFGKTFESIEAHLSKNNEALNCSACGIEVSEGLYCEGCLPEKRLELHEIMREYSCKMNDAFVKLVQSMQEKEKERDSNMGLGEHK
jgi:hypothetical protein